MQKSIKEKKRQIVRTQILTFDIYKNNVSESVDKSF